VKLFRLRTAILSLSVFFLSVASFATEVDTLPSIDARRFDVKPIQKSTSGKIYLFESTEVIPKTGNLILIYDHEKPAMAFRVLKNNDAKRQFVGKRVRRYDQTSELVFHQSYSSIEKVANVLPSPETEEADESLDSKPPIPEPSATPVPSPTPEPTPPEAQDSELDSSSPAALDKIDESQNGEEDEEGNSLEVEETTRIDPFDHILSVGSGYFANSSNFSGSSILNTGFSVSYAHVLFHDVFIMKKVPQDSLAFEMGALYYRMIRHDGGNDLYTMLPFFGDLLYQLHLSQTFSLNLYAGLQYNYMTSASNPGKSLKLLQGPQPNVGLGFFYSIGPQWLVRADVGWDRITGGLSIKW